MRFLKLLLKRETFAPVMAMIFATLVTVAMVIGLVFAAETFRAGLRRHGYLLWNLFLAWAPLIFALLACDELKGPRVRRWRFAGFALGWLVFFPNAAYIFTDVVHISIFTARNYWEDLATILSTAMTGIMLWFVSLYLMQELVTRKFGGRAGWGFAVLMSALTSFGIYLGRFQRFNSWDVLTRPSELFQGVKIWAAPQTAHLTFPILFGAFLFVTYVMLHALTHLSPLNLGNVSRSEAEKKAGLKES